MNNRPEVLKEETYENAFGGFCVVNFDYRRKQFTIALYNDDVGRISMRLNEEFAYNCTPSLIFDRFTEKYIQALDQRAQDFYEEFTRKSIQQHIDKCIDIRR